MRTVWKGSYYRDESAKPRDVRVSADATGLQVESDGYAANWPFADIIQKSGRYPGEPVRLDYGNEIVVVSDRAFLDDLQRHAPQFGQAVRDPKTARSLSMLVGCFAVMLVAVIGVLWLGLSFVQQAVVAMIPVSAEETLGRAAVAQLATSKQTCTSAPLNRAVTDLVSRLSASIDDNPYTFRVSVIDDPEVNAFAAPGGYIVLFRGLVRTASSPEDLAGVLAHEMQHVAQRHALRGMVRTVGITAMISLLAGDVSAAAAAAGYLGNLGFQRGDEEKADREGMRMIQRARIDPAGMVRIYERLALESGDLPGALRYLSTHPEMKDRVGKLKQMAEEKRYQPVSMDTAGTWSKIRESCL